MGRVLFFLLTVAFTAIVISASANAAPFASLNQPSQTAQVGQNGVQLMAFYDKRGTTLDLTVLITDQEGETLRTRIALRDRQHHTLLLDAGDDRKAATRIEFSAYQPNESY